MSRQPSLECRAAAGRLTGALAAAVALAVCAVTVPAGASSKHTSLPAISHATTLSKEPVIHAGKGKAPTKLETKDLVTGTGTVVTQTSTVSVKYVGANYKNGKDFTVQTWQTGKPYAFALDTVVPGFAEGLIGMKVGGRREIVIPPALGYGTDHTGTIVPNETLVFVVDLIGVSQSGG